MTTEETYPHNVTVHPVDCPAKKPGAATCDTWEHAALTQWIEEYRKDVGLPPLFEPEGEPHEEAPN